MLGSYKPKFYECESVKLVESAKTTFVLDVPGIGQVNVEVDEHKDNILDKMKLITHRKYHTDTLYLSRGMRDIDVRYLMNNTWQLYDEVNFYTFEMEVLS